eukprot:TRINITY_DN7796_c0_g1_i1.p1 TRINITY_DN7796_c0_g1~~TRINITY_DN7796_c0_g1_i1.p1  ORF type:complete len:161 (-),score=22.89 TRINITY_DN7796_c0_g1_i1:100-549(-)
MDEEAINKVYNHSEVYEAPVASISTSTPYFSDARGSIQRVECGGMIVNMMHTKKGFMRSGDIHKDHQYDFVYSGKVEVWMRKNFPSDQEYDEKTVYGPNSLIDVPPHTPHLFNFLEESVIAEWWGGDYRAWFYRPYRSIVEETTKKLLT